MSLGDTNGNGHIGNPAGHPLDKELDRLDAMEDSTIRVAHDSTTPHAAPRGGSVARGPAGTTPMQSASGANGRSKIKPFEQRMGSGHEAGHHYKRRPTADGTGACRVKSFHCRLTGDSLDFLDDQINSWLDQHPECEVKYVTSTVGEWAGKTREPSLIINLWM